MDPKNEIQKLIQAELQKWETYEQKNKKFQDSQVVRFHPLHILLKQLVASVEPEYIKAEILETRATIEIGNENDISSRMSWAIEPNFKIQKSKEEYWSLNLWQNKVSLEEASGFKVEAKQGNNDEQSVEFNTADEVIHCLVQEIAKRVAFFRYEKKRLG